MKDVNRFTNQMQAWLNDTLVLQDDGRYARSESATNSALEVAAIMNDNGLKVKVKQPKPGAYDMT